MKERINSAIKAHLIRGAFYVLLLLTVSAIPFARAQRGAGKLSVSKPTLAQGTAANTQASQFPVTASIGQPAGGILWYNGDFNGVNGLSNEQNTSIGEINHVYDDFLVTDFGGWDVTAVFSDNLENTNVTGATWEIRQGISAGNCGILIDAGETMTPVVTPTGRSGFGFTEYMIGVTGLAVHLPFSATPYWLNVTPIGDGTGRSFDSTTSGANCVGMPCGNDGNAFFNSMGPPRFASSASTSLPPCSPQPSDFSMGVIGSASGGGTPTPTATPTATAEPTATPSPAGCSAGSPACGSIIVGTAPTDFIINLNAPATGGVQGSDFMVNGTPANGATLSNGDMTITFHFNTSPAVQGQNTMHIPVCAFACGEPGGCVAEFTCTFTYQASTPTPTPTPTATSTPTPKATPTPRSQPTPRSRPTPAPHP